MSRAPCHVLITALSNAVQRTLERERRVRQRHAPELKFRWSAGGRAESGGCDSRLFLMRHGGSY